MAFPYSLKRTGFTADASKERAHVVPIEVKQTVTGLVVDNETDKDLYIYSPDNGTPLDKAARVSAGHVRRFEFDVNPGKSLNVLVHFDEAATGKYWIDRE